MQAGKLLNMCMMTSININLLKGESIPVVVQKPYSKTEKRKYWFCAGTLVMACLLMAKLSTAQPQKNEPAFTIENYYKTKWGFADEFIDLWKKNHYPLLKKAIENGDIISVIAEKPRLHSGEDTRWDFKVTIVFKNSEKAFDENLTEPY